MNHLSNYFVIAESLEGNLIRLQAISELIDGMGTCRHSLPMGISLLINDVSDSINETLSFLYKAADEGDTNDPDNGIGEDFSLPDLPGQ